MISNKNIRDLQAKKADAVKEGRALTDLAAAAGRDLTDAEQTQFDGISARIKSYGSAIDREQLLAAEEYALDLPGKTIIGTEDNAEKDGKRGFASIGHFAQAVRKQPGFQGEGYALGGSLHQGRMAAAPSTFGGEGIGSDGGFAVPPDFARDIFTHSLGEDSLIPLTDNTVIGGNSMVFPKDETTPWGTDGIRAYWQAEAGAATATKPKLSTTTLRLYKLMALVPLTDELLDDTSALGSYLPKKTGQSIMWKINEAFMFGLGNGTPVGAFATANNAAVTVSKESGQATLTLQAMNLAKMIARLPAGSYQRAVWMINNDVLPALFTLTLGNYPIYLPASAPAVGGIQGNPYGTLLGRPIMVTQHAKSFTNLGDILLVDWNYYRTIDKASGVQTATSMHLYFDADATAFRTTFRIDGQPKIVNPIAPANGANNLSPFVQLQAR